MFYCAACKDMNEWPASAGRLFCKFEVCGKLSNCYDVPSDHLPGYTCTLCGEPHPPGKAYCHYNLEQGVTLEGKESPYSVMRERDAMRPVVEAAIRVAEVRDRWEEEQRIPDLIEAVRKYQEGL
jgi:hypothetical protein